MNGQIWDLGIDEWLNSKIKEEKMGMENRGTITMSLWAVKTLWERAFNKDWPSDKPYVDGAREIRDKVGMDEFTKMVAEAERINQFLLKWEVR
jgi:hypothetical protein